MEVLEHKEDVQNMLLLLFWQIIAKTSLVPEATKIKIISAPLTGKIFKRKQLTNILTPYSHKTIVCNDALSLFKAPILKEMLKKALYLKYATLSHLQKLLLKMKSSEAPLCVLNTS